MTEIKFIRASLKDAETLWKMQKEAFAGLFEKYRDFDTSPANEQLEKTKMRLNQPFTYFYFIIDKNKTVGAIRIVDKKETGINKRISPVFIVPEHRNKGYAQVAILQAEKIHGPENWELETILQESANCHLYEKMGYRRTGKTKQVNDKLTLIYYKK